MARFLRLALWFVPGSAQPTGTESAHGTGILSYRCGTHGPLEPPDSMVAASLELARGEQVANLLPQGVR